jgi:hypothetical protein
MTPEEIAISKSAVGGGAAMAGRPVMGYAGRKVGGLVDKHAPEMSKSLITNADRMLGRDAPAIYAQMYKAKMGPYAHRWSNSVR